MATRDADVHVRISAVSVIDHLRATGMLEPDEIDSIGKLIFDTDARVRKAVISFFAACVKDLVREQARGPSVGDEAIQEIFSEDRQQGYDSPRQEWLTIKCLAEDASRVRGPARRRRVSAAVSRRGMKSTSSARRMPPTAARRRHHCRRPRHAHLTGLAASRR